MLMKKKVLVTGSNGLLGQKLTDLYLNNNDIEFFATGIGANRHPIQDGYTYLSLDITNFQELEQVLNQVKPDVVIHGAAMTQVDDCEKEKEKCFDLNVNAVKYLVELSNSLSFRLVHISTDFIFDGTKKMYTELDTPNPLSYYGWSKLEAEKIIQEKANNWAILRTVLVYGKVADMSRSNIMLWAFNTLEKRAQAKVVFDQFRTPTLAEDLAIGCKLAAESQNNEVYNIAGKDYLSIYELVEKIANMYQFSMENISKVDSISLNQPAKRPPITGLSIEKAATELGYQPHSLEDGIRICLGF